MEAKPNVIRMYQPVEIAGAIVTREAGEYVAVEQNVCGRGWEPGSGGTTKSGGLFSATLTQSLANVRLRAKWRSSHSAAGLDRGPAVGRPPAEGPRTFRGRRLSTYRMLEGRAAQLERYDRDSSAVEGRGAREAPAGSYGQETEAVFRATLPKRTIVRAWCRRRRRSRATVAGFSNMMTVG
jgi:hypothetical protein